MIDIESLCQEGIKEWESTKEVDSLFDHYVEKKSQEHHEEQFDRLITQVKEYMDAFPKQTYAQTHWRNKGKKWFQNLMHQEDLYLLSDMRTSDLNIFMEVTKKFLRDARRFDSQLSFADVAQAMRNVWIIVILQRMFHKEVGYHKAMFAYSMLYPYSDNYLDDEDIDIAEKKQFNEWFTKRLKGRSVSLHNEHQKKISALVQMIEEVFPRNAYPHVYEGLLLIQEAQKLSLHQQDGNSICSKEELAYISYRKGGTSVVADGFLIDGDMREDELQFCMRYGFMLQLSDDLQDAFQDASIHHQTLISTSLDTPLDAILRKLIQYTKDILAPSTVCEDQELLDFVRKDCLLLLCLAVLDTKQYYSPSLYEEVTRCLPVSISYIEKMRTQKQSCYSDEELWKRLECLIFEDEREISAGR